MVQDNISYQDGSGNENKKFSKIESIEISSKHIQKEEILLPKTLRQDKVLSDHDFDMLKKQWALLQNVSDVDLPNDIVLRKQVDLPELSEGTLVHGTFFTIEKLRSIAVHGVLSGELLGIVEDNETYYCADFHRVPENMSIKDYLEFCEGFEETTSILKVKRMESVRLPKPRLSHPKGYTGSAVAIFFNTDNNEMHRLLQKEAYTMGEQELATIVNRSIFNIQPQKRKRLAAVLAGVSSNFITAIVLPPVVLKEEKMLENVKELFDAKVLFYDVYGNQI